MNWKETEMRPFQMNEKTVPTGSPSTKTVSELTPGARMVVSQY